MDKSKKAPNDIRVSFNSKIGGIISYCEKLLKENNMRELKFSAVGGSIGTLVSVVELLKTIYPGLYQVNRFATISYQSVEEGSKSQTESQRLFPKLEVILTLDKPAQVTEGFQDKLSEDERKKLLDLHNKLREERRNRPRRRGFRGRRGGFRGRRGGFRGRRIMRGRGFGPRRPNLESRQPPRGRGAPSRARGNPARGRGNRNN